MANSFLVLVPHKTLHGTISILIQRPKLATNVGKMGARKEGRMFAHPWLSHDCFVPHRVCLFFNRKARSGLADLIKNIPRGGREKPWKQISRNFDSVLMLMMNEY